MIKMRHWRARRLVAPGLFAACIFAIGAMPVDASPFDFPAITEPASTQHHVGKVIWLDLQTTNLKRAKEFYGALFGWDFRDYHAVGMDYAVAMNGGRPVAGLLQRAIHEGEERRSAWLPFIAVRDVDATVRNALLHHAQVRSEPENLPLRGRQALLTDPDGAVFAIEASSSGDPSDTLPTPGSWLRMSLYARDPGDAGVFYQQVFGYDLIGLPTGAGFERVRLSSGGYPRISVNALPTDVPALQTQWVDSVRVVNAVDATARALKLGGRLLVNTQRDAHGVATVVLADPTGAPFGIIELPPTQAATGSP
jgi:hypothetical protein